jgi:branched-chain amino acid transport system permease protein
LNIVVGYAGLLDLGYAAFFAIGAYTVGFLTSPASVFVRNGWIPPFFQNFWPALVVAFIVAAIFGVLLGAPTLRLRGDYLAIVTLGFGEIVPNFFLNATPLTGGTMGLNPIGKPPSIGPFDFG